MEDKMGRHVRMEEHLLEILSHCNAVVFVLPRLQVKIVKYQSEHKIVLVDRMDWLVKMVVFQHQVELDVSANVKMDSREQTVKHNRQSHAILEVMDWLAKMEEFQL